MSKDIEKLLNEIVKEVDFNILDETKQLSPEEYAQKAVSVENFYNDYGKNILIEILTENYKRLALAGQDIELLRGICIGIDMVKNELSSYHRVIEDIQE